MPRFQVGDIIRPKPGATGWFKEVRIVIKVNARHYTCNWVRVKVNQYIKIEDIDRDFEYEPAYLAKRLIWKK